ncbi:MerR family transcriptional regulator [Ruania alkalisoli]|uniref:MerR family transcriptional regulator n=1 Tax=Ruania alkalisoli TaxID=2779775 RepID=A0A7M1ST95_9MICO|nr:MerR family transcriptional regulator [Ruania alkalisoli]QOR70725.1 MerR family transcriptional regulator [Ruania alkalisoli]
MRTGELARRAGCSVQQVRVLAAAGVLPPVPRTGSGYRVFGQSHLRHLRAYQALALAIGPVAAREVMCADGVDAMVALLDAAHAGLDRERREVRLAREAAVAIRGEPVSGGEAMSIGELALALGIRPSTLRHWESEGLVRPDRDRRGYRRYSPAAVRDARLAHQLRQAGYRIEAMRELLPRLLRSDAAAVLDARERDIAQRSRELFAATGLLAEAIEAG